MLSSGEFPRVIPSAPVVVPHMAASWSAAVQRIPCGRSTLSKVSAAGQPLPQLPLPAGLNDGRNAAFHARQKP